MSHAIIFDALQLFSMVLNEMDIYDELGKERVSCRENRVWSLGQEISKYMKLVRIFDNDYQGHKKRLFGKN